MRIVILKERKFDRNLKRYAVFRAMTKRTRNQKGWPRHGDK